jgi:RNA polymerase sigma factor for flagellar operon FliA
MNKIDLQKTWENYQENKDELSKHKLIEHYYELVEKIAKNVNKKMNNKVSKEELSSHGVSGLYRAIEKFDKDRKTKFETYAHRRIHGSMIDGLRSEDWIPRSVRVRKDKLENVIHNLETKIQHKASCSEILQEAGITETEYHKNYNKFNPRALSSIDNYTEDYQENSENNLDFNKYLESKKTSAPDSKLIRKEFLSKLLGKDFSSLERKIIYYYYYEKLTMREISIRVEMSESRISQIHQDILKRLKIKIELNPKYFEKDIISIISKCNHKDSFLK